MKKIMILILFSVITFSVTNGQLWKMRRYDATLGFGPSLFFGDIGGFSHSKNILGIRDMSFMQTRFNVNGSFKYRITQDINVRLSLDYGLLHATDERGSNEGRDFEASTSIFEPSVIAEYYFIKNKAENSYLFVRGKQSFIKEIFQSLDFYAFAGFGGVSYKVRGNNGLIAMGYQNSGFTGVIPAGLGTTMIFSPNLDFGLEVGGRYAFTDFLDMYTSQYSKANDVYYLVNATVTYKLKTGPKGGPSFRR